MPATRLAAKSRRSRANSSRNSASSRFDASRREHSSRRSAIADPPRFVEGDGDQGGRIDEGDAHPLRSARNRSKAPGHRLQRATRLVRSNQDPTPLKVLQPLFDRRRFRLDGPDFGYRLAAIGDRDCLPLANLPDHLGEPRRGFVDRIADAHARPGNQSDGPNGDPGPLGVANLAGVTFASARGVGCAYRSRTRRRPAAIRVRSRLGAWPALSSR